MSDIKQKAREMFDEKFVYEPKAYQPHGFSILLDKEDGEPASSYMMYELIDQIIDLAITERQKDIVAEVDKLHEYDSDPYWIGFNDGIDKIGKVISLIKKEK